MKQTIAIIVIVIALTGAGVFAYMTFFSNGQMFTSSTNVSTNSQSGYSEILPMGSDLDFENVSKFNEDKRIFEYPAVNPNEIGPTLDSIIQQ